MPNVILINCDIRLIRELANRPGWRVVLGRHAEEDESMPISPPDPRQWNLVIDDCLKNDNQTVFSEDMQNLSLETVVLDSAYLGEAVNAHGVRLCNERTHFWHSFAEPGGYRALEFIERSDESTKLADFVDEFESSFRHGRLTHAYYGIKCDVVFRDSYSDPLIEIHSTPFEWLFCVDVKDSETRVRALLHLIDRTLPKIWPEIYSDLLEIRKVTELRSKRNEVIANLRSEVSAD